MLVKIREACQRLQKRSARKTDRTPCDCKAYAALTLNRPEKIVAAPHSRRGTGKNMAILTKIAAANLNTGFGMMGANRYHL
jgi:hypothetical protein